MVTRDELIRMAVEAGLAYKMGSRWWIDAGEVDIHLERFAEMVFEAGRQQGMKQERALWRLAKTSQEIEEENT